MKEGFFNNKKGESALNIPTKVFSVIFGLVILGFLIVVVAGNLKDTGERSMPYESALYIKNETLSNVTELGADLQAFTTRTGGNCSSVCSSHVVYNASTNGTLIEASNYTLYNDGCSIVTHALTDASYNDSATLEITYTLQTKDCSIVYIMRNTTRGVAEFFSNLSTIFTILFVVVIIALIMIVWAVSRKATGGGGGTSGGISSMGRSSDSDFTEL